MKHTRTNMDQRMKISGAPPGPASNTLVARACVRAAVDVESACNFKKINLSPDTYTPTGC